MQSSARAGPADKLPYVRRLPDERSSVMLLIIAILLLLFWGGGFALHVAGGLIHILLVIALVVFILHFVSGRKV